MDFGRRIRNLITKSISEMPSGMIGVPISNGVDSNSILCSAVEAGRSVIGLSFSLYGKISKDSYAGRHNCNALGIDHHLIDLPIDAQTILSDVRLLISEYGLSGKADIECSWPFLYLTETASRAGCKFLATGMGADGSFGLSKKVMIHYRDKKSDFDSYRRDYFSRERWPQTDAINKMCKNKGMVGVFEPYKNREVIDLFLEKGWYELNTPRQKNPVREAYKKEFKSLKIGSTHVNLQLGDSGISDAFKSLLPLVPGSKSSVSVFNAIRKGTI